MKSGHDSSYNAVTRPGWRLFTAFLLFFFVGMSHASSYSVKADYLYQFADYVSWSKASGNITICVVGPDPFGKALDNAIAGKKAKGRKLEARRLGASAGTGGCEIVFVSASLSGGDAAAVVGRTGSGVLTVSDKSGFIKQGGMIEFINEKDRVRFNISNSAAKKAGVKLSAQLLKLAKTVD